MMPHTLWSRLPFGSTCCLHFLKLEVACSPRTSILQTTRYHIPKNCNHDVHHYLNLDLSVALANFICRKLRTVLTNRVLRFLHEKSTKDTAEFEKFYKDYGMFLKEGIVTTNEQLEKASCHVYPCVVLYLLVFLTLRESGVVIVHSVVW